MKRNKSTLRYKSIIFCMLLPLTLISCSPNNVNNETETGNLAFVNTEPKNSKIKPNDYNYLPEIDRVNDYLNGVTYEEYVEYVKKNTSKEGIEEFNKRDDSQVESSKEALKKIEEGKEDSGQLKNLSEAARKVLTTYKKYLGMPYVLGGDGIHNIDCSLFVQKAYKEAGINLPRTTYDQVNKGKKVENPRPGDLIFFDTLTGTPSLYDHVGLYLGNGKFAHASTRGGVKESLLSEDWYKTRVSKIVRVAE